MPFRAAIFLLPKAQSFFIMALYASHLWAALSLVIWRNSVKSLAFLPEISLFHLLDSIAIMIFIVLCSSDLPIHSFSPLETFYTHSFTQI